jgi:hypothetical protein
MESTELDGAGAVRVLRRGARALAEMGRPMRLESGCWDVALALVGESWSLTVRLKPAGDPTLHDWYHLGWLVAALGAPAGSREDTYSTAEPFTWAWAADRCDDCGEWPPTHLPSCPVDSGTASDAIAGRMFQKGEA